MKPKCSGKASHLHPVPAGLQQCIDLANVLPKPGKLPEGNWQYSFLELAEEYPGFREYLRGVNLEEEVPVGALKRCLELKKIRNILYTIARHHAGQPTSRDIPVGRLEDLVAVQTDSKGILRVVYDPLLTALLGVETKRIRECEHCSRIYWAGRNDKLACNRCTHARRQKNYRLRRDERLERVGKGHTYVENN
jgi:hypothetical protein